MSEAEGIKMNAVISKQIAAAQQSREVPATGQRPVAAASEKTRSWNDVKRTVREEFKNTNPKLAAKVPDRLYDLVVGLAMAGKLDDID